MTEVQKFSMSYDAAEDRIAWDAEYEDGATARMWLTQRLCKAVVEAIVPMVKPVAVQEVAQQHQSTLQSWEQAAAVADLGKVPPVRTQPQTLVGLVKTVNIRAEGTERLILTFDFGAPGPCVIGVNVQQLRQTLSVIHGLYVAGGWPVDIWPAWIAQPAAGAIASNAIVN
jgi:hypothetical protein